MCETLGEGRILLGILTPQNPGTLRVLAAKDRDPFGYAISRSCLFKPAFTDSTRCHSLNMGDPT